MIFLLFQLLSLTGMTEGATSDTPVEVRFAFFLPYTLAVQAAGGEEVIVNAIKELTPQFIPVSSTDIKHVDIFPHNNNLGMEMDISSLTPNIDQLMLQAKEFVTCGTSISTGGALPIEYIDVDDSYFEVEYSPGVEPVLTGDEIIICSTTEGPTTTATTTEQKKITRSPTKKPTAGTGKKSGMKALVTLALLVVVLSVY